MPVSFHVMCRFTEGQSRQDQFEAGQASEYLHATADFLASSSGCTFHGQAGVPLPALKQRYVTWSRMKYVRNIWQSSILHCCL